MGRERKQKETAPDSGNSFLLLWDKSLLKEALVWAGFSKGMQLGPESLAF